MNKISSYTTCRNAMEMDYPLEESIMSMLEFSDELCVLDSSEKDDGTLVKLQIMASKEPRLKVKHVNLPWTAPNHGIYDGIAKQKSRELCTNRFLFQFDIDEVLHENQAKLVKPLIEKTNWNTAPLLALPVIDLWGKTNKARVDVNIWKWRLSVNSPMITHGIPKHLRTVDPATGLQYAKHGTDGCDYIHRVTGVPIPCIGFVPPAMEQLRRESVTNYNKLVQYQQWYNQITHELPSVYHYSWFDIARKIKQYKLFWNLFWKSLYNEAREGNPFFPDKTWEEVTDEMIVEKARELEINTGGWVFHQPWDGSRTNSVKIDSHPCIMKSWLEQHT